MPQTSTMPNSLEMEMLVIGGMLNDKNVVDYCLANLSQDDFYYTSNSIIFQAIDKIYKTNSNVDIFIVSEHLNNTGNLSKIGGFTYLYKCSELIPSTANIKEYVKNVYSKSALRKLIKACNEISSNCFAENDEINKILSDAEKKIFDITIKKSSSDTLKHIREAIIEANVLIEEYYKSSSEVNGIPTGFHDLDRMLTGLHGGEFILIGARPSMGKTAIAVQIARNAAVEHNKSVAIFSLEMPATQIAIRMCCDMASVSMQSVRQGLFGNRDESKRFNESFAKLYDKNIYIEENVSVSTSELRSKCRRLKIEKGLDLIVIDYLQLMSSNKRSENRQTEVSEISRQLKSIAMELDIPLIACSQLSRRTEKSTGSHRPVLSDLRESGAIEQDADVVIFVHREAYYKDLKQSTSNEETDNSIPDDNEGELIVAKQRNGPIGTVKVQWHPEFARYANLPTTRPIKY